MSTPKVFISYASEDRQAFVEPFAKDLRARGIDAWYDRWEITPGDNIFQKIFEEGIKQAAIIVIVLSPASITKSWVQAEIDAAFAKHLEGTTKIIPILLDECEVPMRLRHLHWVRITNTQDYDIELNRLVASIFEYNLIPEIGPEPIYSQTQVNAIPELQRIDNVVLRLACEESLNEGFLYPIKTDGILAQATTFQISEENFFDSLQVLEDLRYVELAKVMATRPPYFTVTDYGFEIYIKAYMLNYDDVQKAIIIQIVNYEARDTLYIAEAVQESALVVNFVVEKLIAQNYLKAFKAGNAGRFHILEVSPRLKRVLQ